MQLNSINIDKSIKKGISAPIPQEIVKEREGGGNKTLSYISGSTVIDMLNKIFNYMWNWEVKQHWIEKSSPFFNKYYKGPDQEEYNGREGKWEEQPPIAHVLGTLTILLEDKDGNVHEIKKDGFGSKAILGRQSDQESIFKAADTDALKKAASRLGIGLDLYRCEEEQEYFNILNYEDPWTDEAKKTHEDALNIIQNIMEQYEFTDDDLSNEIKKFSGGEMHNMIEITPEIIDDFAKFLSDEATSAAAE